MTKFLFDERWPRTIVGTSPVTVTTSGLTTTVAINATSAPTTKAANYTVDSGAS